eukprot:jgi/Galph1/5432/GphlegSOOS_G4003.1
MSYSSIPPKFRNYLLAQRGYPVSEEQLQKIYIQRQEYVEQVQRGSSTGASSSSAWNDDEEEKVTKSIYQALYILSTIYNEEIEEKLEEPLCNLFFCYQQAQQAYKDWLPNPSTEELFQKAAKDAADMHISIEQAQALLPAIEEVLQCGKQVLVKVGGKQRFSRPILRCFHKACQRRRLERYQKVYTIVENGQEVFPTPPVPKEWLRYYPELDPSFENKMKQLINNLKKESSESMEIHDSCIDMKWMYKKCRECLKNAAESEQEPESEQVENMLDSIFATLASSERSEEIQEQLFDLTGDFDWVSLLLKNRQKLLELKQVEKNSPSDFSTECTKWKQRPKDTTNVHLNNTAYLNVQESFQLLSIQKDSSLYSTTPYLAPSLPTGTKKESHEGYEEYWIPPVHRIDSEKRPRLMISKVIEETFLPAFRNMTYLNPIQSRVFELAYHSNENLLICAPTGAGKTNIALLAVLHVLKERLLLEKKAGPQIVYIAPMKALASEVTENFQNRLSCLGLNVREMTGDTEVNYQDAMNTDMIVTTPEKWDVITRKGTDSADDTSLQTSLKLLIIDEIHILHEHRGVILEAVVARTLKTVERNQSMIRLVGLSATLPNYEDIAEFLRVNKEKGLFFFDATYRPVPLSLTFIGLSAHLPSLDASQSKVDNIEDSNEGKDAPENQKTDPYRLRQHWMNRICFQKLQSFLEKEQQVLVFVHSRQDTSKTARAFLKYISENGLSHLLIREEEKGGSLNDTGQISHFKSSDLREFCTSSVGIHHAGLLRADRTLVEGLFREGTLRVIFCTATLAWGVNLPAHAVIIKGTQIYDSSRGGFTELGMLDVMQIFGRAGRPQFDSEGEAVMITTQDHLPFYLRLLTSQLPIESQLGHLGSLADHLNAEIVLGNISNVMQAVEWLEYTYLATRMKKNPLVYGVSWEEILYDPSLVTKKREMVIASAKILDESRMIRFDPLEETLHPTELGRIASHFYVCNGTIHKWNEMLRPDLMDSEALQILCKADEFDTVKFRDDEFPELQMLAKQKCPIHLTGSFESSKVNILLQSYISRATIQTSALVSDTNFIIQNSTRLTRALLEIVLGRAWPSLSYTILQFCRSLERRVWPFQHPLRQLTVEHDHKTKRSKDFSFVSPEVCLKLEQLGSTAELSHLGELTFEELKGALRAPQAAKNVRHCISYIPQLDIEADAVPLTQTILIVHISWKPLFRWNDRLHGGGMDHDGPESWWLWVEDTQTEQIYHSEQIIVSKKLAQEYWRHPDKDPQKRDFPVPVFEPMSPQYIVRACSESWHGSDAMVAISFYGMRLPKHETIYTALLDLQPLFKSCLNLGPSIEQALYPNINYFNPLQTQAFHVAYHTDENMLFGAPTGSGKTAVAEFAILRCMRTAQEKGLSRSGLVVYIAPLKALVRERAQDWRKRFGDIDIGRRRVVELTGDDAPLSISKALKFADIICTTPEKWDSISRGWQRRKFVLQVACYILDEVHLLGGERGPVLEMIVSRAKRLSERTDLKTFPLRWIALSTALANPGDLADWLGVNRNIGLFNFRPSVRPVPCEVHIMGVAGKHYSPRMTAMNKPTHQAIKQYSPQKPVLIFVSSRRQTRRTALEMIRCAGADGNPHYFLKSDISEVFNTIQDPVLKSTLEYGVGIHHGGLLQHDRSAVEKLFADGKIHLLVSTATLAWGVNLPAHLVVIKGTEYYDPKSKTYVDMPITDILQMMGRAGRPQYDSKAYAFILVHEPKKNFYKKFLYEPFPVESNLWLHLEDHINAEICGGLIRNAQDAVDFLTWSFFFRRLLFNPAYYHLEDVSAKGISEYASRLVEKIITNLKIENCIVVEEQDMTVSHREISEMERSLKPEFKEQHAGIASSLNISSFHCPQLFSTFIGKVATFYYLSYKSVGLLGRKLKDKSSFIHLLSLLTDCEEFSEIPVRHNEDQINASLLEQIIQVLETNENAAQHPVYEETLEFLAHLQDSDMEDPHMKALLVFCSHFSRLTFPVIDYQTDLLTALEQAGRVLQGMIDIAVDRNETEMLFQLISLSQCFRQACWPWTPSFQNILISLLPKWETWFVKDCDILEAKDFWEGWKKNKERWMEPLEMGDRQLLEHMYATMPMVTLDIQWQEQSDVASSNSLRVILRQNKRRKRNEANPWIYHKQKTRDESWFLFLVDQKSKKICAFRRVRLWRNYTEKTLIPTEQIGKEDCVLFLVSSVYRGLDQQWDFVSNSASFLKPMIM